MRRAPDTNLTQAIERPRASSHPHMNEYRKSMTCYLDESYQMIQKVLSGADFKDAFPHIFGLPSQKDPRVSVRNECGLLLRKAQLHTLAAIRANKSNNLHSLAVHMRVVLECAAQVQSKAHAAYEGSDKELKRVLNASEYDFRYAMTNLSRGSVDQDEIQESIVSAREGIDQLGRKPPKQVTLTDKISYLRQGKDWYDHLSKYFCDGDVSVLAGLSFLGGVTSIKTEADELAFALLLDYLAEQVIIMLVGNGFLLIAINGDSQPFDEAIQLSNRKRSATETFRKADARQDEHS